MPLSARAVAPPPLESTRLLSPSPNRLIEMVDARGTALERDFPELVEHGRGRRVDMTAERREEQAHDRAIRLRDRQEFRRIVPAELGQRNAVDLRHLRAAW